MPAGSQNLNHLVKNSIGASVQEQLFPLACSLLKSYLVCFSEEEQP